LAQSNDRASMNNDLPFVSIGELGRLYASGEVSPVEITKLTLERIGSIDRLINSFTAVTESRALEAAAQSDRRWREGAPLGPLDGVPVSVKDTLMVEGVPHRRGSRATSSEPVGASAPAVERMLEQGAVLLGITTTPEFGAGPITISPLTGITRNPWNTAMNSGGSSGGAAASIAAGLGYAALATDAGGSTRIPAGFCGVVGMKPTGGRVPVWPANVAGNLSTPGVVTRSVTDAALVLGILAKPDVRDVECVPPPPKDWLDISAHPISGLRIAMTTDLGYARRVDPEIAAAVRRAGAVIEGLGAQVVEAHPEIDDPIRTFNTLFRSGFGYALRGFGKDQMELVGEILRDVAQKGWEVSLHAYLEAQDARRTLASAFARFFERYDLLLTPMVSVTAFAADRWVPEEFEQFDDPRAWTPFGYPVNLIQSPAITLPCAMSSSGLPIGLQIIGPRFSEVRVLALAAAYEAVRDLKIGEPAALSAASPATR
jgi:aspartyl-tRNA(Asn)/glutamyl-tRNA(Gln) amidotransferase subunit A